ncbi:MAG TPA: hypothetical protein VGE79_07865, partial [Niastella sp.]
DGKWLVFQRTSVKDGIPCDQIFAGKIPAPGAPFQYKRISSGKGRTTCMSWPWPIIKKPGN